MQNISKGGNLCLNISPKADGTIPEDQQAVLKAVGAWLRTNGEAVYGSRTWRVFGEDNAWRFTCKGEKTVYAFGLDRQLPVLRRFASDAGRVQRVELLGGGEVRFRQTAEGLQLIGMPALPDGIPVFRITLL